MKGRNGKEFHMDCGVRWGGKEFKVGRKYITIYDCSKNNKIFGRRYLDELTLDMLQAIKKTYGPTNLQRTRYVLLCVCGWYDADILQELTNGIVDWS